MSFVGAVGSLMEESTLKLYQCQSKIVFIIILGHCFRTYPSPMVGPYFHDIPGSWRI